MRTSFSLDKVGHPSHISISPAGGAAEAAGDAEEGGPSADERRGGVSATSHMGVPPP
jgi:hypothetical protein